MATSKKKPAAATQPQLPPGHLHELELATIIPSNSNPRKRFDNDTLNELATSIKQVGVMQPIVVHSNDAGGFDLICGERRYKASILAGLESIPAMVYPTLPEDLVFDIQITENLQRENINPMEEADAFQEIVARRRGTPDTIAQRLGKSTKYVYDRLALRRCVEPIQEAVREGAITISSAKKFAQLLPSDQNALLESLGTTFDTARLDRAVEALQLKLDAAPFDTNDPNLYPSAGTCAKCPKRSGCNRLLFDDVKADDICFDKSCYHAKTTAWLDSVIDQVAARPDCTEVRKVTMSYGANIPGVLSGMDFNKVDEAHKSTIYGVICHLPTWYQDKYKLGEYFKIKLTGEQADDDDEDEDGDDEGNQTGSGGASKPGKAKVLDHEEELQKHLASAIIDEFLKDSTISTPVKHLTIQAFDRLSNHLQELVMQKLGVEPFKPEHYNYSKEECEKIIDSIYAEHYPDGVTGTGNLLSLLNMLNEAVDVYIDEDYLTDVDYCGWFDVNNVDPKPLIIEYCKANDHEVDGIWPEPEPEPEADTDLTDADEI